MPIENNNLPINSSRNLEEICKKLKEVLNADPSLNSDAFNKKIDGLEAAVASFAASSSFLLRQNQT